MYALQISVPFAVCLPVLGREFYNYPNSRTNKITIPRCIPSVHSCHAQNHWIVLVYCCNFFSKSPFTDCIGFLRCTGEFLVNAWAQKTIQQEYPTQPVLLMNMEILSALWKLYPLDKQNSSFKACCSPKSLPRKAPPPQPPCSQVIPTLCRTAGWLQLDFHSRCT